MNFKNEKIWIIGASSGIGRDIAIGLASLGAKLILSARRKNELKKLKEELGQSHKIHPLDVSNQKQVKTACKNLTKLDRVIFMSAIYEPSRIVNMDLDFACQIIDVNIKGALYVVKEVLTIFEKQKKGQIVLCGSVVGYTGLPNAQPYGASKSAIINLAQSLRVEVDKHIDVKLINPGFVSTPMTDKNNFYMPMIINSKKASQIIINGLNKKAFEIHFPKIFTFFLKFIAILPYNLKFFLLRKLQR